MRKFIGFLLLAIAPVCTNAQTVQAGIVKEYNEKNQKTPLPGVELNIKSANSTVSDKKGGFTLNFLTLKPGEKVNVRRIEKLGYEIFNKDAIEQWNLNPKEPFLVVMCRSDKFKRIRDNYERVSSESYAQQFKKEQEALTKLRDEGKIKEAEYQLQLAKLTENYEKQLDNIETYVDRFARIDLSELSAVEQQIIELVQQGKLEEAIAKYEAENYVEKYNTEVNELNEISEAITQLTEIQAEKMQTRDNLLAAINRHIKTLQIAGGEINLQKIDNIYNNLLTNNKSNLQIALDYIAFLNTYSKFDKALEVYDNIRPFLNTTPLLQEKLLTNIGNTYNQTQKLNEAIGSYEQALCVLDSSDLSDDYIRGRKEIILSNLGIAYLRKRDYQKALSVFDEGYNLYNGHDDDPFSKIRLLNSFSTLYRNLKEYEKADSLLTEGLNIISQTEALDNSQKEDLQYFKAILFQSKGNQSMEVGKTEEARQYYADVITSLTPLYENNPRKYVQDLAAANYNYGRSYYLVDNSSIEALPYFNRALNLYETVLNTSFIQRIADNHAQTASLTARIYSNLKDTTECIRLCDRLNITLKSCADFPYKGATLLSAIGIIYSDLKLHRQDLDIKIRAIDALETMYAEYPEIYKQDLSFLYVSIGSTYCHLKELDEAKGYFAKGLSMLQELYDADRLSHADYLDALNKGFIFLTTSTEPLAGLEYLRKIQELEPANVKLFEYECIILHHNNRVDDAKKAFSKLLDHFPDYPKDSELYRTFYPQQ